MIKEYNKQELLDKINLLKIERKNNTIITKYNNVVIRTSDVSERYEIFDIVSYLKDKINFVEKSFDIKYYRLTIKSGIQELTLYSDEVKLGEDTLNKTFHILNSTDKTRRLSFNMGIKSTRNSLTYIPTISNAGLSTKHLKGVTKKANDVNMDVESFDKQIELISNLSGQSVKFSDVRKIILGDNENIPNVNHKKFDKFKNSLIYQKLDIDSNKKMLLYKKSDRINEIPKELDFELDAYLVFRLYLLIFRKQDAQIVKKESSKIEKITKCAIRKEKLKSILNI